MRQAWTCNTGKAAEKAAQLHLLQKRVRQVRAEVKNLKAVATDRKIVEPINVEYVEDCIDDLESMLRKSDQNNQKEVEAYTVEWEESSAGRKAR